tara:strand:+ start:657 stop:941 length:285 start_codon:yes stop_codon:yes gene_type:complete
MIVNELIGICGAAVILIAFFMNNARRWKDTDLIYDVMNSLGGLLLVIYSITLLSIPFIILNGVWAIIALRDVALYLKGPKHHHKRHFWKKARNG